jgi:shikimate dehydrogenase
MTGRIVLLGHGIGYSASPAMLNAAFQETELPLRYELADVPAADLPAAIQALRDGDMLGANVTTPHKVAVLELADDVDPSAERAGGANVIVRRDGRLVAHSTDLPAIAEELHALGLEPKRRAVVLGAGGAARATVRALADDGWHQVLTITRDRWATIPAELVDARLLVNATPIGTDSDASPVRSGALRANLGVLDLVYRPSPTRLVGDARRAGATARAGAGVLLRQAALSFALWTGQPAPREVMRRALRAELGPAADV